MCHPGHPSSYIQSKHKKCCAGSASRCSVTRGSSGVMRVVLSTLTQYLIISSSFQDAYRIVLNMRFTAVLRIFIMCTAVHQILHDVTAISLTVPQRAQPARFTIAVQTPGCARLPGRPAGLLGCCRRQQHCAARSTAGETRDSKAGAVPAANEAALAVIRGLIVLGENLLSGHTKKNEQENEQF